MMTLICEDGLFVFQMELILMSDSLQLSVFVKAQLSSEKVLIW